MQIDRSLNPVIRWSLIGLTLIGLLVALGDSFRAMAGIWLGSSTFNHCLLIPPATALLIWHQRRELAQIPAQGSALGLCAVAVMVGFWMLGALGNILTLQNFAVVAMISASVWAVLGWPLYRAMAFPLAYLFLMVPFGEFLLPKLMEMTADFTVLAVRASGVPVYKDGLFFTIPSGNFKIVEACSGIRMLIASIAIGVLFAHIIFASRFRQIGFVAAMIAVSLLANSFRAYTIVMTGHYLGMETIARHLIFGYVVFGMVIFVMLLVGSRFADRDTATRAHNDRQSPGNPGPIWISAVATVAVIAVSFLAPAAVSTIKAGVRTVSTLSAPPLPEAAGQWRGPRHADIDWSPLIIGHDATRFGQYSSAAGVVDVHLIWYRSQKQGQELISGGNTMFDPRRWVQIRGRPGRTQFAEDRSLDYMEMELRSNRGDKRLVRYWYVIDGVPMHQPWKIKLREVFDSLFGRATPASLVAISARFGADRLPASEALDAFVAEVYFPAGLTPPRD